MAWENRNGKQYYYKKKRVGGRVVSEYIGAGPLADLFAMDARIKAQEREEARESAQQVEEQETELDKLLVQLAGHIGEITQAYLIATGHHKHKGQWRRTR